MVIFHSYVNVYQRVSIYLSTYLPIYLSTYLPIYLSIYLSISLSLIFGTSKLATRPCEGVARWWLCYVKTQILKTTQNLELEDAWETCFIHFWLLPAGKKLFAMEAMARLVRWQPPQGDVFLYQGHLKSLLHFNKQILYCMYRYIYIYVYEH